MGSRKDGRISEFRRRQTKLTSSFRFSASDFLMKMPCVRFPTMCFLKIEESSSNGTRRNLTSEPRSNKEFCIGVPVIHYRMVDANFATAWNCFVAKLRITWAARRGHGVSFPPQQNEALELPCELLENTRQPTFVQDDSVPMKALEDSTTTPEVRRDCTISREDDMIG